MSVQVTYWAGRGRAEPLRNLLAAGNIEFGNTCLPAESGVADLAALRSTGKLAYDQLPLVEIDGVNLAQNFPSAVFIAQKGGLYPAEPVEQFTAGHIWAASQDSRLPMLGFPFHGDKDKIFTEISGEKALIGRFMPKWEALLAKGGGPFFLGAKASFADVGVFEAIDCFQELFGAAKLEEVAAGFPLLRAHYTATKALGRLKVWCEDERPKVFLPPPEYAAAVNTTLGR